MWNVLRYFHWLFCIQWKLSFWFLLLKLCNFTSKSRQINLTLILKWRNQQSVVWVLSVYSGCVRRQTMTHRNVFTTSSRSYCYVRLKEPSKKKKKCEIFNTFLRGVVGVRGNFHTFFSILTASLTIINILLLPFYIYWLYLSHSILMIW